jgi:hypothetical protein
MSIQCRRGFDAECAKSFNDSSIQVLPATEVKRMNRIGGRLLYWSPRILSIGFAIFISFFALEALNQGYGFWQTVLAILINLVPAYIVVALILVAWRWEWVGAVLFAAAAVLYTIQVRPRHFSWAVISAIALPLLVIAALFLINWLKRQKLRTTH